jgi:hypothetical protein
MNKAEIDKQAEREAIALRKQGRYRQDKRINLRDDYNVDKFNKLFKD